MPQLPVLNASRGQSLANHARETAARDSLNADQKRALSDEVIDALTTAGFVRHFVPPKWGGQPSTFSDLSQKVITIAQGCASAAWCAVIYGVVGRMAAYLPMSAQQEIWNDGPDVRISASFRSTGTVKTLKDGWQLSGTWHYLSGIDHAQWALLCIQPQEGDPAPRFAAIPANSWHIVDDWHTLGMRGTGSRSIKLEEVYIPSHMTFVRKNLMAGKSLHTQGSQYEISPIGADPQLFISCAVGAALNCLQYWAGEIPKTPLPNEIAIAYSNAAAAIDSCHLIIENNCRIIDRGYLSQLQIARAARDASFAAQLLRQVLNHIFRLTGTRAHLNSSIVQKYWRDIQTLTTHIGLQPEANFINYANITLKSEERHFASKEITH